MKTLFRTTFLACLGLLFAADLAAQCTNVELYGSGTINTSGTVVTLQTCNFAGEYSAVSGAVAGQTLQFTYSLSGGFITVRSGSSTGPVVASGTSPLSFSNSYTGTLYAHWNTSSACGTNSTCSTTTVQCTSCTPPPPPANDECSGAIALTVGATCSFTQYTNTSATASAGAPAPGCSLYSGGDVWFSAVVPAGGRIIIDTDDAVITDGGMAIYSGNCGALTLIECDDDDSANGAMPFIDRSGLTPGSTIYIRFWEYNNDNNGTFSICVSEPAPPPANDNCAGAISLTVNPDFACGVTTAGTTVSATQSTETAPSCSASGVNDDVWYTFTATGAAHQVKITGATSTTAVAVYTGNCGTLTQISGACASTSSGTATLNLSGLTAGTTYRVRVYTTSSTVGASATFTICVGTPPPPPANDECSGAIALTVFSNMCGGATSGTTVTATQSISPITCGIFTSSSSLDVWYSFVATSSQHTVTVVGGTGFDATVDVRSGACNGSNIACADATTSGGTEVASLSSLTPGVTYYVRVYGWAGGTGTFTICITTPIPPCTAPGSPSASGITPTTANLTWGAAPGAINYQITWGTGASCPTGNTDILSGTSTALSGLIPNTTYRFCVRTETCGGGAASSYVSTTFTTAPLPNDACSGAQVVTCGSTISGSTVGATSDSGVGSCGVGGGGSPGSGVWYKLVGNGAQATVSLCGSPYDTKLHVYSGTCGSLTCLTSSDDFCGAQSQVVFNANVGTDYYILVSGFGSATGSYSMNISCLCGPAIGAPWTTTGVGGATGTAIDNVCENTLDVGSNGFSPSLSADKMNFIHQNLCGNQSVTVKVKNITNGGWAGIMFRESTAAGAKMVAIKTQLNTTVTRDARTATNGPRSSQQIPAFGHSWLRLVRNGNIFTGYQSHNGVTWQSAFTVTVAMTNCVEVGLFTQGINVNSVATASFSNISGIPTTIIPLVGTGGVQLDIAPLEFSLFPNPAQSEINVKMGEEFIGKEVTVQIMNQLGQTVMVRRLNEVQNPVENIRLDNFTEGVYFLTLRTEGQEALTKKFIVKGLRP
jgi:hypothetical protein